MNHFLIGFLILLVIALVDLLTYNKERGFIPSILTTLFLIVAFIFGMQGNPLLSIQLGIFGGLIALAFTDLDLWGGIADFKVFVACSLLLPSLTSFLVFALSLTIISTFVKGVFYGKYKRFDVQFPFIPLIALAYLIAGGFVL